MTRPDPEAPKGRGAWRWAVAAAVLLFALVMIAVERPPATEAADGAPSLASNPATRVNARPRPASSTTSAPDDSRRHALVPETSATASRRSGIPLGATAPLELRSGLGWVSVNLSGGDAGVWSEDDPNASTWSRSLHGRVLTAEGAPAPGAVVLVADPTGRLPSFGHLTAEAGAIAGPGGEYRVAKLPDTACLAFAFDELGWSAVMELPAGSSELVRDFRLDSAAALEGRITYGGRPDRADVELSSAAHRGLPFMATSGDDGSYRLVLPAGEWNATIIRRQDFAGGASRRVERSLTLTPGEVLHLDVELPSGVTVAVHPELPAGVSPRMLEYWLLETATVPATRADLKRVRDELPERAVDYELFGGEHASAVMQFHDRPAGQYVLCANVRPAPPALFGCRSVMVAPDPDVQEFTVVLRPER